MRCAVYTFEAPAFQGLGEHDRILEVNGSVVDAGKYMAVVIYIHGLADKFKHEFVDFVDRKAHDCEI